MSLGKNWNEVYVDISCALHVKQNEYTKIYSIFRKILQILPETTVSSPGHVVFMILDGGEHGEHGDHV